jgi:metallophosphoesterase
MKGGNMKFVHLADIHLDMPFKLVGAMGEKRRMMQLDILRQVAEYVNKNKIKYMFIAGDLYEHEYIKDGTINAFINIIKKMPDTQIFISPGNHDPFVAGSVYDRFEFPANVHIFSDLEVVETEDYNIYGYGFNDFYDDGINLDDIELLDNGKKNILVIHRRC